jgi:uncharacterized protein with PIN domain
MLAALYKVEKDMIKQRLDKHIWRVAEEAHRVLLKDTETVMSFGTRSTFLPSVKQEPQMFEVQQFYNYSVFVNARKACCIDRKLCTTAIRRMVRFFFICSAH